MKIRTLFFLALTFALAIVLLPGCSSTGGKAVSLHEVKTFDPQTGKLTFHEVKRDYSRIGGKGLLASKEATGFSHSRSNLLTGASSATGVGALKTKPEPDAIKAAGEAAGAIIGAAGKAAAGVP
ncbi:MAG: hypothetical protein AB1705_21500 [Verrucomicrobiota bacterium]